MTKTYNLEDCLATLAERQRKKIEELIEQRVVLIAALREIEKGAILLGRDPYEHPADTINNMKKLAREALSKI